MKPSPFAYHRPTTIDEAIGLLATLGEDAKVLAGGQSLIPMLSLRLARFDALVDLGRVAGLQGIEHRNDEVIVGAMTRDADAGADAVIAEHVPLLAEATPLVGHFQIRNRGTLGGSVAHADPAAEYPAVALALDAVAEVVGPDGSRRIPAGRLFVGTWMTSIQDAEILTALHFPVWGSGAGFAVEEMARRHGDFALAGVACGVQVAGGTVTRCAISLFGMGSTPIRAAGAEAGISGTALADLDLEAAGQLATADLEPPEDLHASAGFRRAVGANLVRRALNRAIEEATRV